MLLRRADLQTVVGQAVAEDLVQIECECGLGIVARPVAFGRRRPRAALEFVEEDALGRLLQVGLVTQRRTRRAPCTPARIRHAAMPEMIEAGSGTDAVPMVIVPLKPARLVS